MNGKIVRLGLIGREVGGSVSDKIHSFILKEWGIDCVYEKASVCEADFDLTVRRFLGDFDGFNVTIPYKREILEYLDDVVGDACVMGAVNTVRSADRTGYNTDGRGFLKALAAAGVAVKDKKCLVLGAGGAGRGVAVALKGAGAKVYLYSRRREQVEEVCSALGLLPASGDSEPDGVYGGDFFLIVNCTGVGALESEGCSPVREEAFDGVAVAMDLIYLPKKSAFLEMAERRGSVVLNGEGMLFYQAYYADCLYVGREAGEEEAEDLYQKYAALVGGEERL